MFFFQLTMNTHPCPLLLVYIPDSSSVLRTHKPMFSFQLSKMTYLSTQLLVYIPTQAPVHQSASSFSPLRFNLRTYLWTHLLVQVPKRPTYPKIYVPAHFDPFLQANHEDLPVDSTARPHTHRCNRFSSYLFILKLTFRLTTNADLSTHLFYYISTPTPPSHQFINLHVHFNFSRQRKILGFPSTHLLVRVPRNVPENEPTFSSLWLTSG